eukprot:349632-Chlamydomonas_euryale.AAC.64
MPDHQLCPPSAKGGHSVTVPEHARQKPTHCMCACNLQHACTLDRSPLQCQDNNKRPKPNPACTHDRTALCPELIARACSHWRCSMAAHSWWLPSRQVASSVQQASPPRLTCCGSPGCRCWDRRRW